jgi:hypothetical protein
MLQLPQIELLISPPDMYHLREETKGIRRSCWGSTSNQGTPYSAVPSPPNLQIYIY